MVEMTIIRRFKCIRCLLAGGNWNNAGKAGVGYLKQRLYFIFEYLISYMAPPKKFNISKEYLSELHLNQNKPPKEISELLGCSHSLVLHYIHKYKISKLPKYERLIGLKFGRLTVLEYLGINSDNNATWRCKCDCGNEIVAITGKLKGGYIKSCGCLTKEINTTHGMVGSRPYNIWRGMKTRCNNPNSIRFDNYGGRGIKYDPRWEEFSNFWNDMKDAYSDGLSLERIDNNANYSKENCNWVTVKEQNMNKTNTVRFRFNGVTKSLIDWAESLGVASWYLYSLYERGATDEEIYKRLEFKGFF